MTFFVCLLVDVCDLALGYPLPCFINIVLCVLCLLSLVETFNLSIMLCSYLESNLERVKGEIKCEYEAVTTKTRPRM